MLKVILIIYWHIWIQTQILLKNRNMAQSTFDLEKRVTTTQTKSFCFIVFSMAILLKMEDLSTKPR